MKDRNLVNRWQQRLSSAQGSRVSQTLRNHFHAHMLSQGVRENAASLGCLEAAGSVESSLFEKFRFPAVTSGVVLRLVSLVPVYIMLDISTVCVVITQYSINYAELHQEDAHLVAKIKHLHFSSSLIKINKWIDRLTGVSGILPGCSGEGAIKATDAGDRWWRQSSHSADCLCLAAVITQKPAQLGKQDTRRAISPR